MTREEFDILNVNIMAISNCFFSRRSSFLINQFTKKMKDSGEINSDIETEVFANAIEDLDSLGIGSNDPESLIQEGYASLGELKHIFDSAYKKLDAERINKLLNALPLNEVNLKARITGNQIEKFLDIIEHEGKEDIFNELHQYSEKIFYDPSEDLILECLANEDIDVLINNEAQINSDSITYENLENAVLFNIPDILKWFADRYTFSSNDIGRLLILAADDGAEYFEKVLNILNPDIETLQQISSTLEDESLVEILRSYSRSIESNVG